jgi:hypothetical protein
MRCSGCGSEIVGGDVFCPECGIRVVGASEAGTEDSEPSLEAAERVPGERISPPGEDTQGAPVREWYRSYSPATPRRKTSGWAIASLVLGIVTFTFVPLVFPLLAIIFGLIAKNEIRKSSGLMKGSGLASWGLGLGIAGLVIQLVAVLVMIPLGMVFVRPALVARNQLEKGANAARMYYFENDDSYKGMTASDLRELEDSVDFREAPGREPGVVYVDVAKDRSVRLYVYSNRDKKYVASARGDEWRYSYESSSYEDDQVDWWEELEELEEKWERYNPFD